MKHFSVIYLLLWLQAFCQTVVVSSSEHASADPEAVGFYAKGVDGRFTKGVYVIRYSGDRWHMYRGASNIDSESAANPAGLPGTAWLYHNVSILGDPGEIPGTPFSPQDPGSIDPGSPTAGPSIYLGTFAQALSESQKTRARENLGLNGISRNEIIWAGGFYDNFERADTAAGTLGVNPEGWYYYLTGNGGAETSIVDGRVVRSVFGAGASYYAPIAPGLTTTEGLGFIPREIGATVRWVKSGTPGEAVPGQPGAVYAGNTPCAFLNQWRPGSINPRTHILATIASHHLQYWGDGAGGGSTVGSYAFDDVVKDGETTTLRMIFWPETDEVWMQGAHGARSIIPVANLGDTLNGLWYWESLFSNEATGAPLQASSWEPQFDSIWAIPPDEILDRKIIEEFVEKDSLVPNQEAFKAQDMLYFRGQNGGLKKMPFATLAKELTTYYPPLGPIAYWQGSDYVAPTLTAVIGPNMTRVDDGNTAPSVSDGNLYIHNDAVETAAAVLPATGDFTIIVRGGFTVSGARQNMFGQGTSDSTTGAFYFRRMSDLSPTNAQLGFRLDGQNSQKQTLTEYVGEVSYDTVITRSGSSIIVYVDDDAGTTSAVVPDPSDAIEQVPFRLGKMTGVAGSGSFMRYLLIFDKVLTVSERDQVIQWMNLKDL